MSSRERVRKHRALKKMRNVLRIIHTNPENRNIRMWYSTNIHKFSLYIIVII